MRAWRSRCRRNAITTSAPASPVRRLVCSSAPQKPNSGGSRVGGPTRRTFAPKVVSASKLERATRLCRRSPTIATVSPVISPLRWRIVRRSSNAWVGCSWVPSPALITGHSTRRASKCGAPEEGWRMTIAAGRMATRLRAVSSRVSPLVTLLAAAVMLMASADKRLAAISNEVRVRVLGS